MLMKHELAALMLGVGGALLCFLVYLLLFGGRLWLRKDEEAAWLVCRVLMTLCVLGGVALAVGVFLGRVTLPL